MSDPIVTFIYASQTGNCEEISLNLYEEAKSKGYKAERYEFDEHLAKFDLTKKTPKRIVVAIVSSTGDGECPDNGVHFFSYLQKASKLYIETESEESQIFSHLKFAILGLGDSNYKTFMGCPRIVHSAFINLGAKLFSYFGKADEGFGLELVVEPWIENFWKTLPEAVESAKASPTEAPVSENHEEKKQIEDFEQNKDENMYKAKIINKTTEANYFKTVLKFEIELDRELIKEDGIKPGSYCLIYPKNDPNLVNQFIKFCNWTETEELKKDLTENLDFLQKINDKAISIINKTDKTLNLKSTAACNYYDVISYLNPESPTDKEILKYIPKLKPRSYSLSSDCFNTNKIEICFTLEEHEQNDVFENGYSIIKKGVCSHYLSRLYDNGLEFDLKMNKSSMFDLSNFDISCTPMIFVSHGTAVTPFIGVLRNIKSKIELKEIDKAGDIDFYFGIRNKNHDYLYRNELESIFNFFESQNSDGKYNLIISESRPDEGEGEYVQDRINENISKFEFKLVASKGVLLSCGNGHTMIKAFEKVVNQGMNKEQFLSDLTQEGRYLKEIWI